MGRPTDYSKKLLDKCYDYIENYEEAGDVIPSHIGLALFIGKSTTCIYEWQKQDDKKEFKDILQIILAKQHQVLINKGLTTEFNSNITKLVLGKHGYHDKQDTNVKASVLDLTNLEDDELDRKLKQLENQHEQSTND